MLTFKEFCNNDGVKLINEARELYINFLQLEEAAVFDADEAITNLQMILDITRTLGEDDIDAIKETLNENGLNARQLLNRLDTFIAPEREKEENFDEKFKKLYTGITDEMVWDIIDTVTTIRDIVPNDGYFTDVSNYLLTMLYCKFLVYIAANIGGQINAKKNSGFKISSMIEHQDLCQDEWLKILTQIFNGEIDRSKSTTGSLFPKIAGDLLEIRNKLNIGRTAGANAEANAVSVDKLKEDDDGSSQQEVVPVDASKTPDENSSDNDTDSYLSKLLKDKDLLTPEEKLLLDIILSSKDDPNSIAATKLFKDNTKKEDLPVQGINISTLHSLADSEMKKQGKEGITYRLIEPTLKSAIRKLRNAFNSDVDVA